MIGMEHTDVIAELAIQAEELAREQEREDAELVLLQHRAVRALNDAPTLIGYVRSLIVPGGGMSDGMPRRVSKEPPAPLRVEPTDDADEFYAQLVDWVTFWGGVLERPVPASARAARVLADGEVQGFRGHTTSEGASMLVKILAVQLKVWGPEISAHSSARVFYADVVAMVNVLRGRYPTSPRGERPVSPRPCPLCGVAAVGAVWGSENVRDVLVVCANCGHQVEVKGFGRILEWVVS